MPDEGGLQVFWQSESMLHEVMHPAPELPDDVLLDPPVPPLVVPLVVLPDDEDDVVELPELLPELFSPPPPLLAPVPNAPTP